MPDDKNHLTQRQVKSFPTAPSFGGIETTQIGANVFDPRLGTASLVPTRELVRDHRFRIGSFFLGRSIEDDLAVDGANGELASSPIGHNGEGHILVCAETRTGKSERVLVPNLALWPGSALVVDCKGMLATMTAERRGQGNPNFCEGMGQDVLVIDPKGIAQVPDSMRAGINPIDWLSADDPNCISKARILAEALIPDDDGKSGDPYWPTEGRELLACVMTHVATHVSFEDNERTLFTVYKIITAGDVDFRNTLIESGVFVNEEGDQLDQSAFDILFLNMKNNPVFDEYVSTYGGGIHELFSNARKQWEGVRSQAVQSLGWLADPQMKASMEQSGVCFADLKSKPHGATIYLALPSMKSNWRWVRLMIKMFAEETQTMTAPATGHKTLVILDEFTSMKYMPEMNELMDKSAEFGIRMCIVIQRLEQLQEVYPKSWGQFFAAADVRWFFGTECQKTREFLQKELGDTEVMRFTRSLSIAEGTTSQETTGSSTSDALSESTNESRGGGSNWSDGTNDGTTKTESENEGWGRDHKQSVVGSFPLFDRMFENGFFMPGEKSRNGGRSHSYARATGSTHSKGGNSSHTTGSGTGKTHTHSTNESLSEGTQDTNTQTINESVHKRPLIAASEIPSFLAKIVDANDPRFPGQALVLIRGGVRTLVRTSKYYEDPLFHRCYGSHPLYLFKHSPLPWTALAVIEYKERKAEQELQRREREIEQELDRRWQLIKDAWQRRCFQEFKREVIIQESRFIVRGADILIARVSEGIEKIKNLRLKASVSHSEILKLSETISPNDKEVTWSDKKTCREGDPILSFNNQYTLMRAPCDCMIERVVNKDNGYTVELSLISPHKIMAEVISPRIQNSLNGLVEDDQFLSLWETNDFHRSLERTISETASQSRSSSLEPIHILANYRGISIDKLMHDMPTSLYAVYDALAKPLHETRGLKIADGDKLAVSFFEYKKFDLNFQDVVARLQSSIIKPSEDALSGLEEYNQFTLWRWYLRLYKKWVGFIQSIF